MEGHEGRGRFDSDAQASLLDGSGAGKDEPPGQNSVSLLQEYIQGCSDFSPHARILTWNFQHQLQADSLLLFRASVSFVFHHVPHHYSGTWQTSKKKAQRDTAERVRRYLEVLTSEDGVEPGIGTSLSDSVLHELQSLEQSGEKLPLLEEVAVEMKDRSTPSVEYQATLAFAVKSMPKHFAGGWCETPVKATQNAAACVMWYFGIRDRDFAAVAERSVKAAEVDLPWQLSQQAVGEAQPGAEVVTEAHPVQNTTDAKVNVEERTVLMQVQNNLQKAFAKDTPTGEKVWVWSYEADEHDMQMFRALAEIPAIGQTFIGDWCRGKKLAQRNCCMVVKEFLESPEGKKLAKTASAP